MKGKYAARAANRTAAAEAESTETAYRRRVLKLTEERDSARTERDHARAEWAKEVRILRAQLAEGISPRVEALTRELNRLREQRDQLARWKKESQEKYGGAFQRFVHHFVSAHGMSSLDAVDATFQLCEGVSNTVIVDKGVEQRFAERFGTEAALAIRKARRDGAVASKRSVAVEEPAS